jgi:outer membrane receptor for ferrienterochelin and colicin
VLATIPGVQLQSLFGGVNGVNTTVDVRGFGAFATQILSSSSTVAASTISILQASICRSRFNPSSGLSYEGQ